MRTTITDVIYKKEYESKFGTMHQFEVHYDGKRASYSSKSKDQKHFVKGQETEFIEEQKTYVNKEGKPTPYTVVKLPQQQRESNFGKALKKEQSKYSGFAVSYAKDLVVGGKLPFEDLGDYAWILFDMMVQMDATLEK